MSCLGLSGSLSRARIGASFAAAVLFCSASCVSTPPAELVVFGRVYTLAWPEPDAAGAPAPGAPHDVRGWHPDAEAVAIRGSRIVYVGTRRGATRYQGPATRVIDAGPASILPGLVDAHVHLPELGASLERVDLVGVRTEADAVERVVQRAASVPKGDWIVGWGWDEGAWANQYPDMRLLSERVPDHPVVLRGLHTFATWGNRLAFERAGITASTPPPQGGEIRKDRSGRPTGILLNNAGQLLMQAMPQPTPAELEARVTSALTALASAGYTAVHEAGADAALMAALERLDTSGRLPIRVYAMLAARDAALLDAWRARGPATDSERSLVTRSVKVFFDGAMGSRGAWLLEDYSDRPGHRGLGGAASGFDAARMRAMSQAGFQIVVHAIGDRANRETLDFFEQMVASAPAARGLRPRIEHAQVVNASDMGRFAAIGVIASMQPAHAVEDMPWAEARLGPTRIAGAYAWRSLRRAGARLVFSSDLPATDYDIFYGLHSAVTRTDRHGQPAGGWRVSEAMTIEEAIRGWTTSAAYSGFDEANAGSLVAGHRADLTVMDIDPFATGESSPARLPGGRILTTIAGGRVVYRKPG